MPLKSPRLQYFLDFFPAESVDQIASFIDRHRKDEDRTAFWLWSGEEPVLGLFINGERAALYHNKDGAWSANGAAAESDESVSFLLENRQLDEFPAEVVIPARVAIPAFAEYLASEQLSSSVHWA